MCASLPTGGCDFALVFDLDEAINSTIMHACAVLFEVPVQWLSSIKSRMFDASNFNQPRTV